MVGMPYTTTRGELTRAMLTTIRRGPVSATIDSMGAQLMSLKYGDAEYLWQGDPTWWARRAPVLFPIVGNLRDDRATSAAGEVHLGRHGIARLFEHTVVDADRGHVTYELSSSEETLTSFPFDFRLSMSYAVTTDALQQRFIVTNTGERDLPFVVGGHPAFNVPAPGAEGEDFSKYELLFSRRWTYSSPTLDASTGIWDFGTRWPVLDNSRKLPLTHRLFDVDTIMFEDVPDRTVTLLGTESGHGVEVDFDGFDYLGVWSAANDAPFVAIEPWTGCATATDESDVFEEKRGMRLLAPGSTFEASFRMRPF